jgi:ABC-2 type transport system ATP-binding protein
MFEVGVMLQGAPMHPGRTIRAHLRMLAAAGGIPYRRVDEVLELVGLAESACRRPRNLSRRIRLRFGLAAALMGEPRALILDAPADGLDPQDIRWLGDLLTTYASEGRAVLLSGREPAVMGRLADHLVVLDGGQVVADEPSAQFLRRSSHRAVIVRSPHIERLVDLLTEEGASVVREDAASVAVTGLAAERIGELAFRHRLLVHELSQRPAGLGAAAAKPSPVFEVTSVGRPRQEQRPAPCKVVQEDGAEGEQPDVQESEACELAVARGVR